MKEKAENLVQYKERFGQIIPFMKLGFSLEGWEMIEEALEFYGMALKELGEKERSDVVYLLYYSE